MPKVFVKIDEDGFISRTRSSSHPIFPEGEVWIDVTNDPLKQKLVFTSRGLRIKDRKLIEKPSIDFSVDRKVIHFNNRDKATVTFGRLPNSFYGPLKVRVKNEIVNVPKGENLEITADGETLIPISIADRNFFTDDRTLYVVSKNFYAPLATTPDVSPRPVKPGRKDEDKRKVR